MNKIAQQFGQSLQSFVRDEEGAQIIEYALIIAVVSLGLILLMKGLLGTDGAFQSWIDKVTNCLGGAASCT